MADTATRNSDIPAMVMALLPRWLVFILFWLVLLGWPATMADGIADFVLGGLLAFGSAFMSLRLLPPGSSRVSMPGLVRLGVRFLRNSFVAGVQVARVAFSPRMPLRPGWVSHRTNLPCGPLRGAFLSLISLTPGSLAVASDEDGEVLVHVLDVGQSTAAQIATEERALLDAICLTEPPGQAKPSLQP